MAPHVWRQHVQNLVQNIIIPDSLCWMDDDDGISVANICLRSLQEIETRFKQQVPFFVTCRLRLTLTFTFRRPLVSTNSASKLAIIEQLTELPCTLAQCDKSNCQSQTTYNKYLTVACFLPLFVLLLRGTERDVTAQVRRRAYLALASIFNHHDDAKAIEDITKLLFEGLVDVDRSVRLSAGYLIFNTTCLWLTTFYSSALCSLVRCYGRYGKQGYIHADAIFSQLYELFEAGKNSTRETLLISVSSIGKYVLSALLI